MKSFNYLCVDDKGAGIIKKADVQKAIDNGDVAMRQHPNFPELRILNYTKQAQFARHWTSTIRRCRGLVVEWGRGENAQVIIESPEKFFNDGEPDAPSTKDWKFSRLWVSEKLDGYYIAVKNDPKYGLIVTSRGSFENQYVDAAKKLLPSDIIEGVSYFCELLQDFPGDEGLIVARHPKPRLVCWGVEGTVPTPENTFGWSGEVAKQVTEEQLKEYMEREVEGVVMFNLDTFERVKVKTQWYLDMHRIISDCSFKKTVEVVCGGGSICGAETTKYIGTDKEEHELAISNIPEEHYSQMCAWEKQILDENAKITLQAMADYNEYRTKTAKEYALESTTPNDIKSVVFTMLKEEKSGAEIRNQILRVTQKRLLRNTTD